MVPPPGIPKTYSTPASARVLQIASLTLVMPSLLAARCFLTGGIPRPGRPAQVLPERLIHPIAQSIPGAFELVTTTTPVTHPLSGIG